MRNRCGVSAEEAEKIAHALGLGKRGVRWAYRNYFAAGEIDAPIWDGLVARGLAFKTPRGLSEIMPYPVYGVTRLGVEAAGLGNKVPHRLTSPRKAARDA